MVANKLLLNFGKWYVRLFLPDMNIVHKKGRAPKHGDIQHPGKESGLPFEGTDD